jgi:hypothetical protein
VTWCLVDLRVRELVACRWKSGRGSCHSSAFCIDPQWASATLGQDIRCKIYHFVAPALNGTVVLAAGLAVRRSGKLRVRVS